MSFINSNVPVIAITPDEGPNNDFNTYNNIDEVAIDVEDIYFQTEKRKKKIKKHAPKKDVYATDVEDLDGSDDDISSPIIKHTNPIILTEILSAVLETDIPTIEEDYKIGDSNIRNKPKLRSQASVSSSTHYLQPDEIELNQVLTDLEDFDGSDEEDEISDAEISDTDLLKEIIHDSGTVAISDNVKKFLQAVPSPMITPNEDMSGDEFQSKRPNVKKYHLRHKISKQLSPASTAHFNDLTDTEVLQCDDESKPKYKYGKGKRHSKSRKLKIDATDSDDFDLSENEQVKYRRVKVAEIPKISSQLSFEATDTDFISLPQTLNEGDSDTEGIPIFNQLKREKISNQFLQVDKIEESAITDVEDVEGDSDIEEENNLDEIKNDEFIYEFEGNNGTVEEKHVTKKSSDVYEVEESYVQKYDNQNWNSAENETDEEEDQCDSEIGKIEVCYQNIPAEYAEVKFVCRNAIEKPKASNKKQTTDNKLSIPITDNDVLTDIENLDSSDDDDNNEIPVTVVNDFSAHLTDTESVEGDIEYPTFNDNDIPDDFLPSCSRRMILEKINKDNLCEIVSTSIPETDDNSDTINLSNESDLEEISGNELQESDTDDKYVFELDVADEGKTECKDTLKLLTKYKLDKEETDVEDINNISQNITKSNKRYLHVTQDDTDKLTDVEDLDMSDTENVDRFNKLQIVDNLSTGKTDVEDFDASDNDHDKVPEYCRTPDLLRQMGGETICSQEGSGHFSKQDRKKLNEKHNIVNVPTTSPSPTNTDEFVGSTDDDYYSRAETATPLQMRQDLDEASSFRVHSQNTKKIDLDAEDEVMYLKGGGFLPEAYTDTEEIGVSEEEYFLANDQNDDLFDKMCVGDDPNQQNLNVYAELKQKEWGTVKRTPSETKPTQEATPVQDAAPQDSGAVHMGYFTGNQRTLGASCSKLRSPPIPDSPNSNTRISSYTHLDTILDHMLAEVDEQEKLVQLDNSQKSLKPICINSLQIDPSTDAVIELPVSHFIKTPKIFETKHEIILDDDSTEQCSIEVTDLDDDISLTTLNRRSQDSDSLFSFESISEMYFLESIANKYKASSESLNDLEPFHAHVQTSDDEHVYDLVEPKENFTTCHPEPYYNQQDIWWEGTYRDLSIVPEEDEDNISDISQCINQLNISEQKFEIPKSLVFTKQPSDDNCDNISHHSSSDVSQTTGDEYDTSDIEHGVLCNKPVKAEIKLLVKTLDRGREDVEIRSVREFADQVKNDTIDSKISVPKYPSLTHTFPKKEKSSKSTSKPSFTLQRLFVRCPESTGFVNPVTKELSKSNPELVATSNTQFPLYYDPSTPSPDCFKNIKNPGNVDLYANTPFYPCYGSYMKTENVKMNPDNTQNFPTAYCDWLLQPDDPNGGITTSPSKQLVINEVHEPKVVTGESIINDVLSKDIKPVIDQTKMFIRMESQPETSNVCILDNNTPSQSKVKSPDLPDKASKEIDNKKEKSKSRGGFFSSLKSLVGRSLDSSDSESKEEKTPKKKKKEKGTPKKGKKATKEEQPQECATPTKTTKLKSSSPKQEKRTKALYESQELDNIPSIDEIESNGVQVTDLDAEPFAPDDVKTKATSFVDNVINDSQKAATKLLEGKIQEFNLEGTVTPEEVRKSAEPIIINEDEFLVVIEPNNYNEKHGEYEDIESLEMKEKETLKLTSEKGADKSDDEGKTDTLKRKSIGFFNIFGKKDSKESDDESRADEQKQTAQKSETDQKPDEPRKSVGFFGLFSKKSKDEEPSIVEEKDEVKNEEQSTVKAVTEETEFSSEVQQHMIDTADFLLREVELFEDVRQVYPQFDQEKEHDMKLTNTDQKSSCIIEVSQDVQQQMTDRPQKVIPKEEPHIKVESKSKEETAKYETQTLILSDEIQQQMVNTAHFLLTEVENFEDVKPVYNQERKEAITAVEKLVESTLSISPEVQQQMVDTANFLYTEVELFDDVKPRTPVTLQDKKEEEQLENVISASLQIDVKNENINITSTSVPQKTQEKIEVKSPDKVEKPDNEYTEAKGGFFTKLGEKFSTKSVDKKEEPREKKSKKKKDKKPGFFSKIGDRLSGTLSDEEKEFKQVAKSSKEDMKDTAENKVLKIENKIKNLNEDFSKIEDKLKHKGQDTKVCVTADKEKTIEHIKESVSDVKDTTKESTDKTVMFFSQMGDKFKDGVHDTKESVKAVTDKTIDKIDESNAVTQDNAKDLINNLEKDKSDVCKHIQISTKEAENIVVALNDDATDNIKDTASGAAKKIKDSTDDAKETIRDTKEKTAEKFCEFVDNTKDITKNTADHGGVVLSGIGDKIKETVKDTKYTAVAARDSGSEKIKDTTSEIHDAVQYAREKTEMALSDTGDKIKEASKSTALDVKDKAKDAVEKSGGFFGGLGEKIKETVKDTKEEIVSKAKSGKEEVEDVATDTKEALKDSADKTEALFSKMGEKMKGSANNAKENIIGVKDKTTKKFTESVDIIKDEAKQSAEKTEAVLSDVGDKVKEAAEDTKENLIVAKDIVIEKTKETTTNIKDTAKAAVDKTGTILSDTDDKIKETAKVSKDSVVAAKDSTEEKVKETASNIKDTVSDTAEKTGGFFSGLGKKIKGSAKDVNEEVDSKVKSGKEEVVDTATGTKDVLIDSVDKTEVSFRKMGDKLKESVHDVKDTTTDKLIESIDSAKGFAKDSTKNTEAVLSDVGDSIKENLRDSADKTEAIFSKMGDKIKDSAQITKENVTDTKDKTAEKLKVSFDDARDTTKTSTEKAEEVMFDVSGKIKEAAKDTKASVVVTKDTVSDKVKETANDAVEKTGGFFSGLGKIIKGSGKEAKEEVLTKSKSSKEKVKVVAADTEQILQDSADKTKATFSKMGDKIKDNTDAIKDNVIDTKDKTAKKLKVSFDDARDATKESTKKAGEVLSGVDENIKETAEETKQTIVTAKDSSVDKIKEITVDASDATKEAAEKTGGFFSGLGKKIKGTAKGPKEEVVSKAKSSKAKVEDISASTQNTLHDSAEKSGAALSSIGDQIKETAEDTKETYVQDIANASVDKTRLVLTDNDEKIKEAVKGTKESIVAAADCAVDKAKESASDVKDTAKDAANSSEKIKDTKDCVVTFTDSVIDEVKETASDAKDTTKDAVEKTGGFFSGLGKKIKGSAKDAKEEVISKAKSGKEKVAGSAAVTKEAFKDSADKTEEFISDLGEKIAASAHGAKETILDAKGTTTENVGAVLSGIDSKIKGTAMDTESAIVSGKDSASEKVKETASDVKDTATVAINKTGAALSDIGDKIKKSAIDTKDNVVTAKDSTKKTVKETISDAKDTAKDAAEKTEDFFSGLGKKVKGSANDAKEEVVSKAKSGKEKVADSAANTKEAFKDSADKTEEFFSDLGEKITDSAHAAKETITDAKDKTTEKVGTVLSDIDSKIKETAMDTKDAVVAKKDSAGEKVKETALNAKDISAAAIDKTGAALSDTGDKIKDTVKDTNDSVVAITNSVTDKVKEATSDAKDTAKDAFEKTEGFFSGLGKKIKGSAKDAKEEVVSKAKSGEEKIADSAADTKKAFKDSGNKTKEFLNDFGGKIADSARGSKETITDAKDTTTEKVGVLLSGIDSKIKSTAMDTKDAVVSGKDSACEKVKETASNIKDTATVAIDKTGAALSDIDDKIQKSAIDIKDNVFTVKDSTSKKVKETASDAKDAAKEATVKTGGFLSGLGKKIKGSAKDTKGEVVSKAESGKEKVLDFAVGTKQALKDSADKSGEFFSDLGDKITDSAHGAKEAVIDAKDRTTEKVGTILSDIDSKIKETAIDTKDAVVAKKDSASEKVKETALNAKDISAAAIDKTGAALSDTGDKIKDTVKDTKDNVVAITDSVTDKVKETTSSVKDAAKDAAEKSEGFFGGLGKKIKGSAKDAKEEVVSKAKSGKDQVTDSAADTKEAFKDSVNKTEEFFNDFGGKITDSAQGAKETITDAKDTTTEKVGVVLSSIDNKIKSTAMDTKDAVVSAKESASGKVKETASDIKDTATVATDKTETALSDIGEKIKKSAIDTKDNVITVKDSTSEKVKETASGAKDVVKDATVKTEGFLSGLGKKIKGFAKDTKEEVVSEAKSGKEKVEDAAIITKEILKDSADKSETLFSKMEDKIKTKVQTEKETVVETQDETAEKFKKCADDTKDILKSSAEKVGVVLSDVGDKIKVTAVDIEEGAIDMKDTFNEKINKTASNIHDAASTSVDKTGTVFSETDEKVKETIKDGKDSLVTAKGSVSDKVTETASDAKITAKDAVKKTEGFLSGLGHIITGSVKDAEDKVVSKAKSGKEKIDDAAIVTEVALKDSADKTELLFSKMGGKMKHSTHDAKETVVKEKDKISEKIRKSIDGATGTKEILKESVDKTEAIFSKMGDKFKDTANDTKQTVADVKQDLLDNKRSDFIYYVTTPTMQRKGIGGSQSQRLSRDERPPLIDVSNMPIDISSDEDDYIVTEPNEIRDVHSENDISSRGSPLIIENMPEHDEHEITHKHDSISSPDDSKRRPLFHIGSREEEFTDWGDKSEKKDIHSKVTQEKSDTIINQTDVQTDIDLIENKLSELGKALDDLEKVNIDLEPEGSSNDDRTEHKLRRVERRFERMASETMEKDIKEAKESQMTSPEVEAKREEQFRTMVSQLSQEEVSECQRLYSSLWDDVTFTPSEEWDSKTPDSQPDDIQDLPQGEVVEVVYMGPVTLNKDHLINKAGIEVDVIPIKRSPCTSPLPKKKLQNKGRARSAMGFYKEKQVEVEERGSLPDLQNAGKSDAVKLNIQKGSIMSAVLKSNPAILNEKSASNSTSSLYFNVFDNDNQFQRRKSTESLTKGTVVSAVKEWMTKSTPFGSTENVRSVDAISLADTTISIFDDDDIDSVDMYSDSACQLESESSRSDNHIPDIHIFRDSNIPTLSIYDAFKYHDIQVSDNDIRIPVTSQMRGVHYTLDQFSLGETSGGPLTYSTTEGSTLLTNLDISAELTTEAPKPKPRIDKTPDSSKTDASYLDNEQVTSKEEIETSEVVAEDIAYSDRKKFWETVSSKKDEEKPDISVKKRMSLYEEQIFKQSTQENLMAKKRTSVHEISVVPPVPKPRSTLAQIPMEDQTQVPDESQLHEIKEIKETVIDKSETLVSEYRAAFKDPSLKHEQTIKQETKPPKTEKAEKSESVDSESEYLKYEHQAYENPGYLSDDQEIDQKLIDKHEAIPQIKRRQMSISQPPVAAARKTIFERSASLPTEDLQDVSEKSVKARKQFFEQQLKKEMVIDQLMTQLEEEELQEYKTLTSTEELHKVISPEEKIKIDTIITNVKESEKNVDKDAKEVEKKLSPISSSSSQDTKTEDDITQYTPTSVRDLTKYFQPGLLSEVASISKLPKDSEVSTIHLHVQDKIEPEIYDNTQDDLSRQELTDEESFGTEREVPKKIKQPSTESEQSISSERSIELGSAADELPYQVAETLQYKSDSISKPSDSLEVHVDKSEIEDSEKGNDIDQDGTDVEVKSLGAEEYLSDLVETEDIMQEVKDVEHLQKESLHENIEEYKEEKVVNTKEIIGDLKYNEIKHKELEKEFKQMTEHKDLVIKQEENKETKTETHLEIKEAVQNIIKDVELEISETQPVQKISPIREHKEEISDTIWEVSVQSQSLNEIIESVTEIPIERQIIVEKDEELSGSVRDESDLGSEIHQDHSESYESEKVRSESHSEVEQLILESLYHQKIHPEDARKIASELIDDIQAEIERRNLMPPTEIDESEPPAPHPEVAKNQISDYLRQLAESKGLDAKEVELVESVLARKQNELSKLGRHDTQTSSMEITDEDLKYSGAECDMSPIENHKNILEEQIEQLEKENNLAALKGKTNIDEENANVDDEKFSEKTSDIKSQDIHVTQDREINIDDIISSLKTETTGKVETTTNEEKEFSKKSEQKIEDQGTIIAEFETKIEVKSDKEQIELKTEIELKSATSSHLELIATKVTDDEKEEHSEKTTNEKKVTDTSEVEESIVEEASKKSVTLEGERDALATTHEEIEGGFTDTTTVEKTEVHGKVHEKTENKVEQKQEITISDDGTQIISEEIKEKNVSTTVSTSEIIDHKREEKTSVTTYVQEIMDEPITTIYEEPKQVQSDESKSSPYESAKSPEDQISSSSSVRKDDSDTSHAFEKPEVVFRKTKFYKEFDTSSSSGNLKTDRRSGADFEAYSSSGESHYHSFEQDSGKSRPCSSDVEGLMAAGSSEYESALTSQDISSRSHITSTEYHTAVSSLSSRESMKSLDSESSGHMASIEVSEASETLVPSTFELEGDILDGAVSQLLEDEVADSPNGIIEPYDRDIPEHIIRGDYPMKDKKGSCSFDTISDSDIHGESMDISEEDSREDKPVSGEVTSKMKRSQEMTFQPVPKAIIADSPQSENALEMDERFGSSLEDGSVLSMSLSSQSDVAALRTVIEMSRRDSDKLDGSVTISGHDSISASNMSLDKIQPPLLSSTIDTSTSTGAQSPEPLTSVTLTTSVVDENGTQSVSTQVISQAATTSDEVVNGPTQVDYVPEYDDVVETKKVRGHRRQESTSTFVPSMIPGFTPRTDAFKATEYTVTESEKQVSTELTLKEEHHEETKDVDETEESYETEADQGFHREQQESGVLETESDQDEDKDDNEPSQSRPHSRISKTDSEDQKGISIVLSDDKPDSELVELMKQSSEDFLSEPIERPTTPEPTDDFDFRSSVPSTPKSFSDGSEKQEILYEKQMKMSISEKSSIEEGEAEAAFSMVAHISPAHMAKGDIDPILEDEDAEKHELETRERAQKEMEQRRAQIIRDASPGSIPDIMVTEHMTPLVDREFHYPDLELEEKEALAQKSAPQTPASISSKSSEDTDQGREYILEDASTSQVIPEEPELEEPSEEKQITDTKSDISHSTTVEEKTVYEAEAQEPVSATESPNSDSFEMLEKPDIIDDFVVIEEVAKEAAEHDTEGKSVQIQQTKYIRKHDEEVEEYLVKSAPTPLTRMTDLKYYPDGSSGDELGPFDMEDSPPQAGKKSTGTKTTDGTASRSYAYEYDKELEASKKWIEMQFQGDQAALINAGYGYEMEFERGPLEDIKEEEATDFESSRIGSLDSQKQSVGSLGSVKDSFSSTPEYDVLAGRKFFTRSGEHDDVSMSSLQEFESLERIISLENRRHNHGSQDSSSNGSFSKRYHASRSGQGDDVSMSSLKEFEGLETACIEAHIIEIKAKEEEALLTQIDETQENLISESESCKSLSSTDKKNLPQTEEEDYEKRMFEIDEIIKQAQSNVEKFIDVVDKTESMGRGDSLEEVAKVPDLDLDEPLVKSTVHTVQWGTDDVMQTSTDSLDLKPSHHASTDSLDMKAGAADIMTASTDSIEYQIQAQSDRGMIQSDSIEIYDPDKSCMITSDSLELTPGVLAQFAQLSDSIDEDGSRIGEPIAHDQSSSSGFSIKDEQEIKDQRAEFLLGSTDSLDPSSSTATHATYQYETDSVLSGSFTSGGSNTMVSSTDTIDPLCGQAHGVDIAAAVRKVWFDEDSFGTGTHFTTELLDDGSKPFVTEVIEPCEGDPEFSHTIHRKVELPPEVKKITFKGPNANLQLRQFIENFGEGEDVQETQEVDKDGNVHVKRVVQKRFVVKSDPSGEDKRISGPELESYLQQVSQPRDEFDLSYRDPTEFGLTKQTRTDSDGTKTIYGQMFTTQYSEGEGEESSIKQLLSSIASDVTEEYKLTRHVDNQQEQPTGTATATFSGAAAANVLRAQGSRRKPLRFDISVDDQTEVDPREHDWRFILPRHDEHTPDDKADSSDSKQTQQQRDVPDQHQLSSEMKDLLEEMEKHSKQ